MTNDLIYSTNGKYIKDKTFFETASIDSYSRASYVPTDDVVKTYAERTAYIREELPKCFDEANWDELTKYAALTPAPIVDPT